MIIRRFRLNGYGDPTPEETAAADTAVNELKRQFYTGLLKIGFTPDLALKMLGPISVLVTYESDYTKYESYQIMKSVKLQLDAWAGEFRSFAEAGVTSDGIPMTWDQWYDIGKNIAASIQSLTDTVWNHDYFVAVKRRAPEAGNWLKDLLEKALTATIVIGGLWVVFKKR